MESSSVPSVGALKETFEFFKVASIGGVHGVLCIKSESPGPVLGITACTHGNEPAGLATFKYLLEDLTIKENLLCGTLYLVVNNIEATENFFSATTEDQIRRARYRDINMNRLPNDVLERVGDTRYEIQRTQELQSIWKNFTHGLDIHSTTVPTEPMIISRGGKFHPELVRGFPIEVLISNIDQVQLGIPAFALYGTEAETPIFAIEAGQNEESETFDRAARCAVALLQNLKMLGGAPKSVAHKYQEYCVKGSIIFPDKSFDFVKDFKSYDAVAEGDLLATNPKGEEVKASHDGHLIMPTSRRGSDKDITEEVAFLSEPVKIHHIS